MKLSLKKGFIFFSLFLVFLMLTCPAPASAFWERIVAAVTAVPTIIIAVVMAVVIAITGFGVVLVSAILEWVVSPDFVSLSYTRPCLRANNYQPAGTGDPCNPIIGVGLDITQHLANLLLVGLLVYIALAIALRMGEHDAKKLFPKLIIIALLVNFAPVLVGLIVDAANILMNYFLTPLRGGFSPISSQLSTYWDTVVKNLGRVFSDLPGQLGLLGQASAIIFLNITTLVILFLFAGLFIFRYIAIWIIVILAPLAFIFWILPGTQKLYNMWWNNLIQWAIVGIPMAFFLYLGVASLSTLTQYLNLAKIQESAPGIDAAAMGVFSSLFPYFIVAAFLGIGFMLGLTGSAMGASQVLSATSKFGKWAGGSMARGTGRTLEEKLKIREKAGALARRWENTKVARWVYPQALGKYAQFRPAISSASDSTKHYSSIDLGMRIASGADAGVRAVGSMMNMAERGDFQDYFNAYKKKYKVDTEEKLFQQPGFRKELTRQLQIAKSAGMHGTVLRSDPRLAKVAPSASVPGYIGLTSDKAVAKAVSESRAPQIKNWEKEVLDDEAVILAGMERGREFWESIQGQIKKGRETSLHTMDKIFSKFIDQKRLAHQTATEMDNAWQQFRDHFKTTHEGRDAYFDYVESEWGKTQGWRRGQYMPGSAQGGSPTTSPTVAGIIGLRRGKQGGRPPQQPPGRRPPQQRPPGRGARPGIGGTP